MLSREQPALNLVSTVIFLLVLTLAILFGLMAGVGAYQFIIIMMALLLGPVLVVFPKSGLWVTVIFSLVGVGLIELYLPSMQPLKWSVLLLSTGLAATIFIKSLFHIENQKSNHTVLPLVIALCLFCLSVVISSIVNWHGIKAFAVGMKGYFQVWGLLIAFYFLCKHEKEAGHFMRFLLMLALIQLPFVLHQYFWLVPKRSTFAAAEHGVVAVDVVAGTFGGTMFGGGRSSSLALLIALVLTMLFAMWRQNALGVKRLFFLSALILLPIFLNEAKIVVVLLPLALFILFFDRIKTHPLQFAFGATAIGLLLSGIIAANLILPTLQGVQRQQSMSKAYEQMLKYNVGEIGYGGLKLNRLSVYPFWLEQHRREGLVHILIGHGPGETNDGSVIRSDSLSSSRYKRYGIGLTGLSAMLWELGLLGISAITSVFILAYTTAKKLAHKWHHTGHWPLIKTAQIAIPLFALNLLHNNYFVNDLSFQALFVLVLGYIFAMTRFERKPEHA